MLRHLIKTIVCTALLLSSTAFAATTNNTSSITDPNKTMTVDHTQKQFTITLASTPSTGFSWLLDSCDFNMITPIKHEYISSPQSTPGASGVESWTFKIQSKNIAGPQLAHIHFIYARMWDVNNTTIKKADFTVVLY